MTALYLQIELVRGVTHWIGWFNVEQLFNAADDGWHAHKFYPIHQMRKDKQGRLVLLGSEEIDDG